MKTHRHPYSTTFCDGGLPDCEQVVRDAEEEGAAALHAEITRLRDYNNTLSADLAVAEDETQRARTQRDAANNRVAYLEGLMREMWGKSGVRPQGAP